MVAVELRVYDEIWSYKDRSKREQDLCATCRIGTGQRMLQAFICMPLVLPVCPMLLKCITRYISIKMQLTSVVALLSSLAFAAANPPGYGRPAAYAQASVPWTSSTCSAVYSTTTIISSKPVTSVVTTTTYKPSTYTTSSPTVISSVTTVYRPKTTSVVSTITTTTVGKSEEHLKHDAKHDPYIS